MAGKADYEFRTTVVAELHDDMSFRKIGEWIHGARRYFLQKFTDRETVPFEGFHAPAEEQIQAWAQIMRAHAGEVGIRG
ncbi:MAG: anaerobic ribonucleoside-triphosphate reductase activating protein, partial [Clostridia bacterium]|nr:anaerobic ribonucleoside-triphosphate reductase activating protein [Clostridia bacterium]